MSHGWGKVQVALYAEVLAHYSDLRPELWLCVSTHELGLGEHRESRRRAARTLAREGVIEVRTAPVPVEPSSPFYAVSGIERRQLFARLPLGPVSREYVREIRQEYLENLSIYLGVDDRGRDEIEAALRWTQWYSAPEGYEVVFLDDEDEWY